MKASGDVRPPPLKTVDSGKGREPEVDNGSACCRTHVFTDPLLRFSNPMDATHSSSTSPRASIAGDPHAKDLALKSPPTSTVLGSRLQRATAQSRRDSDSAKSTPQLLRHRPLASTHPRPFATLSTRWRCGGLKPGKADNEDPIATVNAKPIK